MEMALSLNPSCLRNSKSPPFSGTNRLCKYTGQSLRVLPVRILTVGKKRLPGVQLLVDEYIDKLRHYCAIEDVLVRSNPKNARDEKAQIQDEDTSVMSLIRPDDWVVMLDEHGDDIRSEQLAELIGDSGNTGASRLIFCIGGPYGLGGKLRERADSSIKLSSLILNHQIALIVLMEQLYRSIFPATDPAIQSFMKCAFLFLVYLLCHKRSQRVVAASSNIR